MNDTITPVRSVDLDWQHLLTTDVRLTIADRLSVRIGLWLLLRAERRHDSARDSGIRARAIARERAREAHERTLLRVWKSGVRLY